MNDVRTVNRTRKDRLFVLVTSGLGSTRGGIGTVSEGLAVGLRKCGPLRIWSYRHSAPRWYRLILLAFETLEAIWFRPTLVVYEHVDLAKWHGRFPWLRAFPYVVYIHGTEVWRKLNDPRKSALLKARMLLANSRTTVVRARLANPWLPEVRIVWPGIKMHSSGTSHRQPHRVLVVGRMSADEAYKGHDQILSAWATVIEKFPDAQLVVVGHGDDTARLQRRMVDERIPNVVFTGYIPDCDRDVLFSGSSVLLFPSTSEGFGLVAIEAAAAGVAVIALRGSVVEELFPNNGSIVLVDSNRPHDIAGAVVSLLANPVLLARTAAAAQSRVHAVFCLEHFEARLIAAMRMIVPA